MNMFSVVKQNKTQAGGQVEEACLIIGAPAIEKAVICFTWKTLDKSM